MGRFLAGVISTLLLVAAGVFIWKSVARSENPIPPPPRSNTPLVLKPSAADLPDADRSREEKRFDRYDKDRNESITRAEYLAPRQKAFARLDVNADGRLSFEEWAVRTTDKFSTADADRSGALTREEFSTTRARRGAKPRCDCATETN